MNKRGKIEKKNENWVKNWTKGRRKREEGRGERAEETMHREKVKRVASLK